MSERRRQHRADLVIQASRAIAALPACCTRSGYTYFVRGAGMIKIGCSSDPRKRLPDLQVGSPVRLELLAVCRGADMEGSFHARCRDHRSHGEWFREEQTLKTLRIQLLRSRVFGVCLSCAFLMNGHEARFKLASLRAPSIAWQECKSVEPWNCGPSAWFTSDGQIATDGFYGVIGCKRAMNAVERSGIAKPYQVAQLVLGDRTPMPTKDLSELRRWSVGCVRCALSDGRTKLTTDIARIIAREWAVNDNWRYEAKRVLGVAT